MTHQQIITTIKQHRQLLPLLLLTAFCFEAVLAAARGTVVLAGETYDFALSIKHYIAFGAIAVNLLTYFFLRPLYKYTLALTIAIGLFNLMTFSALSTTSTNTLTLGSLKLSFSFQPNVFLAGLLAYIINFKRVNTYILDSIGTKRTPDEQEKYEKIMLTEATGKFKERYKNYSNEILTEIITEKKLVPEALEAARQLLNERKTNN